FGLGPVRNFDKRFAIFPAVVSQVIGTIGSQTLKTDFAGKIIHNFLADIPNGSSAGYARTARQKVNRVRRVKGCNLIQLLGAKTSRPFCAETHDFVGVANRLLGALCQCTMRETGLVGS